MKIQKTNFKDEDIKLFNQVQHFSIEVFAIYNKTMRTPVNWKEERERLQKEPNTRAQWKYAIPDLLTFFDSLQEYKNKLATIQTPQNPSFYDSYTLSVAFASLRVVEIKLEILKSIHNNTFTSDLTLRKRFFNLDFNFEEVENDFNVLIKDTDMVETGKRFAKTKYSPEVAQEMILKMLTEVKKEIPNIFSFPENYEEKIMANLEAEVLVVDDPSFLMRCTTKAENNQILVLLSSHHQYSDGLILIGFLHEFVGHAFESAVFDKTFIPENVCSEIYAYANVYTPNLFDVRAEVFADKVIKFFVQDENLKFFNYRRHGWLVARAMGDYMYHIKGATVQDVADMFKKVGLEEYAFDEAVMASIFISGMQGMYYFANKEFEKIEKELNLPDEEFISRMLFTGKIPFPEQREALEKIRI